tara:strand:- start:1287 stop:3815 length:2529 start_codon:yes stop_codon:yes gene_type:complete
MASRDYKIYGSGGRNKNLRLDDGLRAMQEQTTRITNALKEQELQNRIQSQAFTSGLEKKAKKEADNRRELQKLEVETPRKMRLNSIKQNYNTKIKSLERQAAEYDKLSGVWAGLSPTLAKKAKDLFESTEKYLGHTDAIKKFNDMQADGTLDKTFQMFEAVKGNADTMGIANEQYQAYARNDDQVGDYINTVQKIRNPYLKTLLFEDLKKNFDGLETHFHAFLKANNLYNKDDIISHYQYRALEWLEQYGIKPDSEIGFKVQRLFRNKGAVVENQLILGHKYETHSAVIESSISEIGALDANPPNPDDFIDNEAGYIAALESHQEQKNALWIKAVTNQNQLPLRGNDGRYALNPAPNMRNSIVAFASNALMNPRYHTGNDDGDSGFTLFAEEILGVTKENPLGYLIPGADPNSTKKSDRLLGKFPFLLEQLKEEWYNEDKKKLDIANQIKDSELRAVSTQIEADIKNNKFANEMGWDGEFWKVWESNKGNKYVNSLLSNYIGLGGNNIDYDSAIVQAFRSGSVTDIMAAWAVMDQNGGTAKDQNLRFIVENLNGLAGYLKVDITALDERIDQDAKALLNEAIKHDVTGQLKTVSQVDIEDKITATFLATYMRASGDTPKEKYENTIELIKSMLGYEDGQMGKVDNNSVRGWGEFRHKVVGGKVIFTNSPYSGRSFEGITQMEIDDMLSKKFNTVFDANTEKDSDSRLVKLNRVVQYAYRNYAVTGDGVSDQDLYDFIVNGKTDNEFLNHLAENHLDNVSLSEFKRSLGQILDSSVYNQYVMMDGDEWCNYYLGPGSANLSPKDKPTALCVEKIEKDFDIPAWEVLVDDKVKEKLNQFLQERN